MGPRRYRCARRAHRWISKRSDERLWMRLGLVRAEEMDHLATGGEGGVGDEPAVAAPPEGLGAHDREGRVVARVRLREEPLERGAELGRVHVVGESAEAGVAP